jgi:potassium efflux system protein
VAEEGLWERRHATFGTEDLAVVRDSFRRLERLESLIQLGKPYFLQQIEVVGRQIAEYQNRLRNQPVAPDASPSTRDLLDSYRQRDEFLHRALARFQRTERLVQRWKEALDQRRLALPIGSRFRDLFGELSSFASKFWNFELVAVEDTITVDGQPITGRRAITVGKVALAVLILVLGTLVARFAARWAERFAVRRFQVEPNQASLIRRWIMVVLVLALVAFSLVSVRIPLTVFAFAGGALAIGLGFGTQNLLKNFISGIIILFERPFRVGDILDVAGRTGVVTGVGIRSSVLALWDGTETLIPNSALLENNLTNWTYSSRAVRFSVTVGVAYGSDTRRVAQLLAEAADRHGLVLRDPKPIVLFQNFGESALLFELRYWVDVVAQNSAQIASDLRHMIAVAFSDHDITIAFPQRDIRLDAAQPLQIEIQRHRAPAATAPAPESPHPRRPGRPDTRRLKARRPGHPPGRGSYFPAGSTISSRYSCDRVLFGTVFPKPAVP